MIIILGLIPLLVPIFLTIFLWKLRNDENYLRKIILFQNESQGINSKITPLTIRQAKFGINLALIASPFLIVLGLIVFYYIAFGYK